MKFGRTLPVSRLALLSPVAALVAVSAIPARVAHADVFGRLHIVVTHVTDKTPVSGATVTLHDTAGVRPNVVLTTDAQGVADSPPLENRAWQIAVDAPQFTSAQITVTVASDTTTDTSIALAAADTATTVHVNRNVVSTNQTATSTRRDAAFIDKFPATAGNPQSLRNLLITDPGFVQDSVNQVHPRGEHSATSIYLDGFRLPGAFQGRAGQVLLPDTIQSLDAQTGGYAPEYGGETSAILNVNLKAGTIKPFSAVSFEGGGYNTFNYGATIAGQAGKPINPDDAGQDNVAKKFGYLLDYSGRQTNNAIEAPQPGDQTAHNGQLSQSIFGNFGYTFNSKNNVTLTLEDSPANTQVANRTGLPSKFIPVGQGYGFTGARGADGLLQGADDTQLGGETEILPSQQAMGQDIYQNDENKFGVLNFHHTFSDTLTSLLSFGASNSRLDIRNHSPAAPSLNALPDDSSIEYNPTLLKKSSDTQFAANVTKTADKHTLKAGFLVDQQSGDESYLLQPGSQLALDALFVDDPYLAPAGTAQTDASGNAVTDALGNPVYLATSGATSQTTSVHRSGHYDALYAQDTWHATRRLTLNYGLRYDIYQQTQTTSQEGQPDLEQSVSQNFLSPRINLAYGLTPRTIGRLSYNKLFIQPPLAQGGQVGDTVQPETYNDYNASVERQIASNQVAKIAYYVKEERHEIDTNLLIPGTQIGAFNSVNFDKGEAHGIEFSYDLRPLAATGVGAYLAYAYSIDRPEGLDSEGGDLTGSYNDHDVRHSLSGGVDYTFKGGANAGLTGYFSSGTQSSTTVGQYNSNVIDDGKRQARSEFNFRLSSPGFLDQRVKLSFEVQNLFNTVSVMDFNSGFTGTRFQQGRRALFGITGTY